ncbi:MAG: hypothetical protein KDK70_02415 [Myxococcales bacterium]|nr:hypothetical protein [Myxococcales bacterium]
MRWLDGFTTLGVLILAASCADDGLAPADTDASTSGQVTSTNATTDNGGSVDGGTTGAETQGGSTTASSPTSTGDEGPGSTGDTGPLPPSMCTGPRDCVLVNDCCECAASHVDDVVECPLDCDVPMCDALGIPDIGLTCEDGECGLEERNCADGLVVCDSLTPECPEGTLPEVTPAGDCWTGACIPLDACGQVPSCKFCDEDEACVELQYPLGSAFRCDPLPKACDGTPTCACLPPQTCAAPLDTCADAGGLVQCSCIAC